MRQRAGLLFTFVIGSAFILGVGCSSNNQKERLSEATKEEISGLRQEVTELNVALNECRNQQAAVEEAPPAKKEAKKEVMAEKATAKKVTAKKETTVKKEVTAKKEEPQPKVIEKTVVIEKQAPPVVVEKKEKVVEVKQELPLPPPDRYEVPDHPPSPDAIWLSGYWDWDGEEYVWIKGRWVEEGGPTS